MSYLSDQLLERLPNRADRQSDDIGVVTVDAADISGKRSLDRVTARFVHRLGRTRVSGNFVRRHRVDVHVGLFSESHRRPIAVVGTLVIAKILSLFMPLRVNKEDERRGLDETQHGEKAYPAFTGMD